MKWWNRWIKSEIDQPDYWRAYKKLMKNYKCPHIDQAQFIALDLETTGTDFHTDRILSIGAIRMTKDTIDVHSALELFLKQHNYNASTASIHGITHQDSRATMDESQAIEQLIRYINDGILVGHHIRFDIAMIDQMLFRHGLSPLQNDRLDTARMYRATRIRSNITDQDNSLDKIAENYRIDVRDRHTAAGDAMIAAFIFMKTSHSLLSNGRYDLKKMVRKFR